MHKRRTMIVIFTRFNKDRFRLHLPVDTVYRYVMIDYLFFSFCFPEDQSHSLKQLIAHSIYNRLKTRFVKTYATTNNNINRDWFLTIVAVLQSENVLFLNSYTFGIIISFSVRFKLITNHWQRSAFHYFSYITIYINLFSFA